MSRFFARPLAVLLIPCLLANPIYAASSEFQTQAIVPALAASTPLGSRSESAFSRMYRLFKGDSALTRQPSTTLSMLGTGELFAGLQFLALPLMVAAVRRYRSSQLFQFRSEAVREAALAEAESITTELEQAIDQSEDLEEKKELKALNRRLEKSPLARSPLHRWPDRLTLRSPERREEVQARVRALYAAEFFERMRSEHRYELEALTKAILRDPHLQGIPEDELRENGLPRILIRFIERNILSQSHVERTTEGAFRLFSIFSQTPEFMLAVKVFFWNEYAELDMLVHQRQEAPVSLGSELPEEIRTRLLEFLDKQIGDLRTHGPILVAIRDTIEGLVTDAVSRINGHPEIAEEMVLYFRTQLDQGTDMGFFGMRIPEIPL
jgi:hypothetical protein